MKVAHSCLTLWDIDYTVHGILQTRILGWVAFPFSRGSSQPRDWTQVSWIAGRFFTSWAIRERARILEWVAYPFSRGSSWPRNQTGVSCTAGRFFTNWAIREAAAAAAAAKSLQSCPTLCDPIDGSPSGSSVPGILRARTLEWVAISFSNAWKWKVKVKSLTHVQPSRPHRLQPTRLLHPWDSPGVSTGVGCHCLLHQGSYSMSLYRLGWT